MSPEIQHLLQTIERQLDWGAADAWQSRDFDKLNQLILEKTGVSLSASTLKRVWGRVQYGHAPSAVTLDALALGAVDYFAKPTDNVAATLDAESHGAEAA